MKKINDLGGFIFYVGQEKKRVIDTHCPKRTYHYTIKEALKRLQQECEQRSATFNLVLDEHQERAEIFQTVAVQMYNDGITTLVEPPFEADSKLFQSVQCADWICGLVGRIAYYKAEPEVNPEWQVFETYFGERLNRFSKRSSIRTFGRPTEEKLNSLIIHFDKK